MAIPAEVDPVADDEVLFRRVRSGRRLYKVREDGRVEFEPTAFSEATFRPSVDRAKLCDHNPLHTKIDPSDGVTSVVAGDVRLTKPIPQLSSKGKPIPDLAFGADVEPKALADNLAHAEIFLRPECNSRGVFRRLCVRLAILAEQRQWAAAPEGVS